jgi:hypothetical protein
LVGVRLGGFESGGREKRTYGRLSAAILISVAMLLVANGPSAAGSNSLPRHLLPPTPVDIRGPFVLGPFAPVPVKVDMAALPRAGQGQVKREVPIGELESAGIPLLETRPSQELESDLPSFGTSVPAAAEPEFTNPNPNFDGIPSTNRIPPDTVGDVGPNHYIQMVNTSFQIFDKTGASLAGPSPINSLWTAAGLTNACALRNDGDPVVLYDHLADRWLLSQFAVPTGFGTPPTFECVAVSQTPNPAAGTWNLYQFQFGNAFDYPKLGLWPDAYYMSSQRGFPSGAATPSLDVYALDRATMLAGGAVTVQQFTINGPSLILLPSDLDGPAPPAGTPAFFARQVDGNQWGGLDRVDVFSFSVNWATPAMSTFTALPSIATTPFDSNLCGIGALMDPCVPQPGTTPLLATLPHWAMYSLQYRTFGTREVMVFNHTVDADGTGHAGIRWYELSRPPAGTWTISQQGTHSPDLGTPGLADDLHRWMGSIAMDGRGNIALGYSSSSGTAFPSVTYTGRLATDPLGTLPQAEVTMMAGGGSQTPIMCTGGPCGFRWGDYSAMRVDPVDGCTFWYTQEYIPTTSAGNINWRTRIGAFRFAGCVPDVSIDDVTQNEGDSGTTTSTFTVSLSAPSGLPITVDFATADGTATTADGDYQAVNGTVTFPPGATSQSVVVAVNGDMTFEPDETFFVNLSNPQNATILDGQGVGTILNDDPQPRISISDLAEFEGNAGTTDFVLATSLSNPSYQTITVDFATADGSAIVGDNDYVATSGTITFAPGDTSESVTVVVNGDTAVEPDETFFVDLSNPQNATILDGQGVGTILNDDLSAEDDECTITGTNKADVLVGTPGNDVICGRSGDDVISGMGGHDVLIGGMGKDTLIGGPGNDLLLGGTGRDDLQGNDGNDNLRGGMASDNLSGGAQSDALGAGPAPDSLNTVDGVSGNDSANGGPAPDTCAVDPGDITVSCP